MNNIHTFTLRELKSLIFTSLGGCEDPQWVEDTLSFYLEDYPVGAAVRKTMQLWEAKARSSHTTEDTYSPRSHNEHEGPLDFD